MTGPQIDDPRRRPGRRSPVPSELPDASHSLASAQHRARAAGTSNTGAGVHNFPHPEAAGRPMETRAAPGDTSRGDNDRSTSAEPLTCDHFRGDALDVPCEAQTLESGDEPGR